MSAPTEYARLHVVLAALEHARAGVAQAGKALDAVHGDLAARAAAEKAEPPRKIKAGEGGNVGAVIDYRKEGIRIDLRINDVTVSCTEEQVQRMLNLPLIKQIAATADEDAVDIRGPAKTRWLCRTCNRAWTDISTDSDARCPRNTFALPGTRGRCDLDRIDT